MKRILPLMILLLAMSPMIGSQVKNDRASNEIQVWFIDSKGVRYVEIAPVTTIPEALEWFTKRHDDSDMPVCVNQMYSSVCSERHWYDFAR